MSIARKCDRCGTYHDGRIYKVTIETPGPDDFEYSRDLCIDCKNEFDEFLTGIKPKNLLERLLGL